MLTGRRAFKGTSPAELLSSVLRDEPDMPSLSDPRIPHALDLIVHHCLEKSPDERFQSARDLAFHLDSVGGTSASQRADALGPLPASRRLRRFVPLGLLGLVLLGLAFEVGRRVGAGARGPGAGRPPLAFEQVTDTPGQERQAQLAPGGESFVYVSESAGNSDIWHQRVGGRNPVNLTADSPEADTAPAYSPDGERIAFCSERDGGGIFVMGSTGESVKRLTDFGEDPAWSPDGKQIVFSTHSGQDPYSRPGEGHLWLVDLGTGDLRQLTREHDAVQPRWSPSGLRIAFWGLRGNSGQRDLWTIPADAKGEPAALSVTEDPAMDWNPVWSPDGKSLYFSSERGGSMNLWRVAIDDDTGRTRGAPEPVTTPSRTSGSISFSRDGKQMMYVSSDRRSSIQRVGLDPATGKVSDPPRPVFRGSRVIYTQDISPDGEWIAFSTLGGREDLYVVKSDGTGYRQLTDDAHRDRGPRWSPDGTRIAFYSDRSGRYETWAIRPDGSGIEQLTKATGLARRGGRLGARRKEDRHERQREDLDPGPDAAARPASGRGVAPARGRPVAAAPLVVAGREHAGRWPRPHHVAQQRHAALLVRHADVHPAARGPRLARLDERQPPAAGRPLRSDRDARHAQRPGDAGARGVRSGDQPLARRSLAELHREPVRGRRLAGDARTLSG